MKEESPPCSSSSWIKRKYSFIGREIYTIIPNLYSPFPSPQINLHDERQIYCSIKRLLFHWIFLPIFIEYFPIFLHLPYFLLGRSQIGQRTVLGVNIDFVLLFIHCSSLFRKSKKGREPIRSNDLNAQQITKGCSFNGRHLVNRFIDHYYRVMTPFITRQDILLKVFLKLYDSNHGEMNCPCSSIFASKHRRAQRIQKKDASCDLKRVA